MILNDETTVIIRYANLTGAIVEVRKSFGALYHGAPGDLYDARCTGCLDEHSPHTLLGSTRTWAATHSATCRALPQPEPTNR